MPFLTSAICVRKRLIPIAAAFILSTSCAAPVVASDYQELSAIGKWRLTAALDGADITALDEREARHLVGSVFTITKDHVKFGKRECAPP